MSVNLTRRDTLASLAAIFAGGSVIDRVASPARAACCYFAAKDKDVLQPAQKAFITWDPVEKVEIFTVQPKFEGNAADFGMVIPTPSRPKLDEMPRDFFKQLAVFTILEPMALDKYKSDSGCARLRRRRIDSDATSEVESRRSSPRGRGRRLARLQDHQGGARRTTCTSG